MLACGNEPSGRWVEWVTKFVEYWEKKDPRHVYTGASVGNGWQWQPRNQYHVKAGARGLTWSKKQPSTQDDYRFQNHLDTVRQPTYPMKQVNGALSPISMKYVNIQASIKQELRDFQRHSG